jgi:hypothetical protein
MFSLPVFWEWIYNRFLKKKTGRGLSLNPAIALIYLRWELNTEK